MENKTHDSYKHDSNSIETKRQPSCDRLNFCLTCGEKFEDTAIFCPFCGSKI